MAVIITPFSHQEIPINTPFSLNIAVSGNPSDVMVKGRIKGFKFSWNEGQNRIEWRGTPEVLADNVEVTVIADDAQYTGTFSIVPVRPIIGTLTRVTNVQRGIPVSIPIPITGHVSRLEIEGPWIGLKERITATGAELYGTIPVSSEADFTTRSFSFVVEAYNGTVFVTAILEIELVLG